MTQDEVLGTLSHSSEVQAHPGLPSWGILSRPWRGLVSVEMYTQD